MMICIPARVSTCIHPSMVNEFPKSSLAELPHATEPPEKRMQFDHQRGTGAGGVKSFQLGPSHSLQLSSPLTRLALDNPWSAVPIQTCARRMLPVAATARQPSDASFQSGPCHWLVLPLLYRTILHRECCSSIKKS